MEMIMPFTNEPGFLRNVLLFDAITCVATGLLMTAGARLVAGVTDIPTSVLMPAGFSLFPIAAFIALVAMRLPWRAGVALVILGNAGWVAGSLLLLAGAIKPNAFGTLFVLVQAIAVAGLAALEYIGLNASQRREA
jgi:hypothetical protein